MSDLDNMTAAELRTKLAQYGLPVMPITASTRGLLVKKLRMVMEGKADTKSADSRRSLAKYSSGEDSDIDIGKTKEKAKNRRATIATAMLPPPINKTKKVTPKKVESPVKSDSDRESEPEQEPVKTHEEVKTVTTRRITRTFKTPASDEQEDYETGSDTDVDMKDNKNTSSSYKTTTSTYRTSLPSYRATSDYLSSTNTLPSTTTTTTREAVTSPSYSSYTSNDLNSIRSRLGLTANNYGERSSLGSSYTSKYSSNYKPATTTSTEEIDSPYLSSFTRRLESLKAAEARKDKDSNGSSAYVSKYSYKTPYKRAGDHSPDFRAAGEKNAFKTNLVSCMIVGVGLVFFLGVAFLYLGMRGDVALQIEDKNSVIPICQEMSKPIPTENCVDKSAVSRAKDLLHILYPELNKRVEAYGCGKSINRPYMTENDIIEFINKEYINKDGHIAKMVSDLYNLQVMLLNNPSWGISVFGVDSENKATQLTSMEYVIKKRSSGETALGLANVKIPWRCSLTNIIYYGTIILSVMCLIGFIVYGVQKMGRMYTAYTKKRKDQIYSMVEQIIDIVSQDNPEENAEVGQAMAISHVRDMIIPPQNREKMTKIWDEAIQFLEKNESRVRFEVERVAGEEYRTLRWVSPQGSPRAKGPGARSWQGQAFETQKGSVNNLTVSPTPCLKIRHMVDKNDKNPNLKQVIQDAILEKCGPTCKILHIEIDTTYWCVYVKCATPADAGIVYQNLHGWWYEGNLITVKYIRLERYMDHFPSSPSTGPYLKASSQL